MFRGINRTVLILLLIVPIGILFSTTTKINDTLEIGADMPAKNIELTALNQDKVNLSSFKQENGTLVIFSCNTCPFVVGSDNFEGWEKEYNGLSKLAKVSSIGMVLVNSNAAKRDKGDSLEDMVKRAKEKNYMASYVLDEKSKLADAFGAKTTPHVFLFNKEDKLVYEGQIDNAFNPKVKKATPYLKNAMIQTANSSRVDVEKTDAVGCSIKRLK
ncbi:MAG: redoxin family protein [Lishizhenia sp.]